jgi:hypothetical protein
MEEICGGGQGLNWAVEPRGERASLIQDVPNILIPAACHQFIMKSFSI